MCRRHGVSDAGSLPVVRSSLRTAHWELRTAGGLAAGFGLRQHCSKLQSVSHLARFLIWIAVLALNAHAIEIQGKRAAPRAAEAALVRVNITTEIIGAPEAVEINGARISGYQPRIIQVFPSTGVVIDDRGHVLTFLGYRWVDVQTPDPRIEILTSQGQRYKGKLIGVDQSVGAAVVRALEGRLRKAVFCERCEIRDGATVVAPVLEGPSISQFESTQIVSIGQGHGQLVRDAWVMKMNRPLPGVGEPLLDIERRVLGFVTSQRPSPEEPMGTQTVVYPISRLLASAQRIIQVGGDIRTGWLGVFLSDTPLKTGSGVLIWRVEEGSPAQKAGILAQDVLMKWNGREISGPRAFIQMVQDTPIGSKVELDITRQGRPLTVSAVIAPRKQQESPARFVFSFPNAIELMGTWMSQEQAGGDAAEFWTGIHTVPLSPQLANFLQVPVQAGLLVVSVQPETPFSQAGVLAGDIILSADGELVANPESLISRLKSRGRRDHLNLKLLRKGVERRATIELP